VMAIEFGRMEIAENRSVPPAFPNVLPMPARKGRLDAFHVRRILYHVRVPRHCLVSVPIERRPVLEGVVILLLVDREPEPFNECASGVHDFLLLLLPGQRGGVLAVAEHDAVVLRQRRFSDVAPVLPIFHVVRHGCDDLASLLVQPYAPVFRFAHRVHPPGLRENRDVCGFTELLVAGFSVGHREHRAPPSRRRRISSRPPPRRLLRRAGTKTPAPFARSSLGPRPGLCASPPRSPTG
jgi:hypothetical protein